MLTALRGSKNIHYSEFFPMGDMSLPNLFVYSSIHLYWYGLTDIYFIFGLYFVTQLVTALAPGSSFISPVPRFQTASILLLLCNNVIFVFQVYFLNSSYSYLLELFFKRQCKLSSLPERLEVFHFSEPLSHKKQRNPVSKPIPVDFPGSHSVYTPLG